jgi:hypothetical protein
LHLHRWEGLLSELGLGGESLLELSELCLLHGEPCGEGLGSWEARCEGAVGGGHDCGSCLEGIPSETCTEGTV